MEITSPLAEILLVLLLVTPFALIVATIAIRWRRWWGAAMIAVYSFAMLTFLLLGSGDQGWWIWGATGLAMSGSVESGVAVVLARASSRLSASPARAAGIGTAVGVIAILSSGWIVISLFVAFSHFAI